MAYSMGAAHAEARAVGLRVLVIWTIMVSGEMSSSEFLYWILGFMYNTH